MVTMGINQLGPNQALLKRKFRYLFEVDDSLGLNQGQAQMGRAAWAVQAARPSYQFDLGEIKHTQETVFYPIRLKWEALQITLVDVNKDNGIYWWLNAMYDVEKAYMGYFDQIASNDMPVQAYPKRHAMITMYNGIGEMLEQWVLHGCFPEQVNWGDLDYTTNDFAQVSVTIRFDRAYIVDFGAEAAGGRSSVASI